MEARVVDFVGQSSPRGRELVLAAAHQNKAWQLLELLYQNQGDETTNWLTDDYARAGVPIVPLVIDGNSNAPSFLVAAVGFPLSGLDQGFDLRAIEIGAHHAHVVGEAAERGDGEAHTGGDRVLLEDRRVDEGGSASRSGHLLDGLLAPRVVDVGDERLVVMQRFRAALAARAGQAWPGRGERGYRGRVS